MLAKRSTRALALLLVLPSAAFALGLGDIHLSSPLNAPLDAEIELVDVAPDELNTVQVQLASRDTFGKVGLEWPAYLNSVQLKLVRTTDGREIIKLKSADPISEPFVTLLIEVNWARGHLVREYTMLLDPPVYAPGGAAVASAPVSAPATGVGAREGSIARAAEPPPPAPPAAAAAAEQPATTPAESSTATAAPTPTRLRLRLRLQLRPGPHHRHVPRTRHPPRWRRAAASQALRPISCIAERRCRVSRVVWPARAPIPRPLAAGCSRSTRRTRKPSART